MRVENRDVTSSTSSFLCSIDGGKNWSGEKNEHVAREWLAASEDAVVGAEQTCEVFKESVRRRFLKMALTNSTERAGMVQIYRQHCSTLYRAIC